VRELGVEATGGLEERLGRLQRAELVEGDACVVQEDRLARLDLERIEGAGGDRHHQRRDRGGGGVRPAQLLQAQLEQRAAGLVRAVVVRLLRALGEQLAVALQVVRRERGLAELERLLAGAASGFESSLRSGEAERHEREGPPGGSDKRGFSNPLIGVSSRSMNPRRIFVGRVPQTGYVGVRHCGR
jgi:hypothetical protein